MENINIRNQFKKKHCGKTQNFWLSSNSFHSKSKPVLLFWIVQNQQSLPTTSKVDKKLDYKNMAQAGSLNWFNQLLLISDCFWSFIHNKNLGFPTYNFY